MKPQFATEWQEREGGVITFQDSYLGSGAQSRAIEGGFEADVAALSLEPDIQRLVDAGLVRPEWKDGPHGGIVSRSIVVLGVRAGNPMNIRDWADLAPLGRRGADAESAHERRRDVERGGAVRRRAARPYRLRRR